jgi:hypothetical protein
MTRQSLFLLLGGMIVGLGAATHLPLRAQGDGKPQAEPGLPVPHTDPGSTGESARTSVQEALIKPYNFRFGRPTPLSEVTQRLARELGAPVVLDLAALDRLEIKPDETVTLELRGVRLKTGLKLLLDQVGLTYRVVAEDNLLILTDKEGSEDPVERVMAEVHELHRDIHDLQDSVDELRELSGLSGAEGARVRKPTIIEELPENAEQKPEEGPALKSAPKPDAGTRPPSNTPARPRTRL